MMVVVINVFLFFSNKLFKCIIILNGKIKCLIKCGILTKASKKIQNVRYMMKYISFQGRYVMLSSMMKTSKQKSSYRLPSNLFTFGKSTAF